tara:strand:+ start:124 stop:513 length:390 start_codon:yes stop_codon:yes gene_type:complete
MSIRSVTTYNKNNYKLTYKECNNYDIRKLESTKIITKYPERIPVIVEKNQNSDIANIDKNKYLVPKDLTIGQLVYVIRKRIKMPPEMGLYIFIQNTIPPQYELVSTIYEMYKDNDGFLYVTYSGENTFG